MKFFKEIKLKTGRTCVLRSPTGDDAGEILEHMKISSGETDNMLRYPDEIVMTEEEECAYLENIAASGDGVMIAAVIDGKIVANAGFNPVSTVYKCSHRAEFGISILRDYWGLGIGSAIMAGILECARQAGYERLELDVVSDNERAIALYEKFGFTAYGTNNNAFKLRNGKYQSLLLMSCQP